MNCGHGFLPRVAARDYKAVERCLRSLLEIAQEKLSEARP